jgi:GxxExxY protein
VEDLLKEEYYLGKETYNLIGAAMEVHKELGNGFLESIYQEALALELTDRQIPFHKEQPLSVQYKNQLLNKRFFADFLCYDQIIVELKATDNINDDHLAQVLNYTDVEEVWDPKPSSSTAYTDRSSMGFAQTTSRHVYLKATNLKLGLILNFGTSRLQYKRVIL